MYQLNKNIMGNMLFILLVASLWIPSKIVTAQPTVTLLANGTAKYYVTDYDNHPVDVVMSVKPDGDETPYEWWIFLFRNPTGFRTIGAASLYTYDFEQWRKGAFLSRFGPLKEIDDLTIAHYDQLPPGDYLFAVVLDPVADYRLNGLSAEVKDWVLVEVRGCDDVDLLPILKLTGGNTVMAGEDLASRIDLTIDYEGPHSIMDIFPTSLVGIYLSPDPEITPDDMLLDGGWLGEVSAWPYYHLNLTQYYAPISVPTTVRSGDYYLGVIVDVDDTLQECHEDNNVAAVPVHVIGIGGS